MIAWIQIIVSLLLTVLYGVNHNISLDLAGVGILFLVLVITNIIMIVILLLIFVMFIYATEKISPKSNWKPCVFHQYNLYLFTFFYRTKLIITRKENLPKNNNFVAFANHIEYTDPLFMMQAYEKFPLGFVSKDPLFKYPVLKNLLYSTGCIPITKYADRSALETIIKAIKQVREGQPMGIFPEGKRTYSNDLIEFKPGAFKLPQKAKADISPICLYNMHDLARKWRIMPTKIYLHILPIITYDEYKDLDTVQLADKVFNVINDQMDIYKKN